MTGSPAPRSPSAGGPFADKTVASRVSRRGARRAVIRGLYAVTPDEEETLRLVVQVRSALAGGASVVQYRNKPAPDSLRRSQASALRSLCTTFGVPFIINDHLDLALETGADGLHIGAHDLNVIEARAALGPEPLLGVSCYNDLDLARAAVDAGADYVAFGSVFSSTSKPEAVHAPLALFSQALCLNVPLVGIGGVTLANLPLLIASGAHAAAIISDLFDAGDVTLRARQLAACF